MSQSRTIVNRVANTQGGESIAYLRSAGLTAGNSFITLAKIPGLLKSHAGLVLKPALHPNPPFDPRPRGRNRFSTQRMLSVRSEARGLTLSSSISAEPPIPGTVSLFN